MAHSLLRHAGEQTPQIYLMAFYDYKVPHRSKRDGAGRFRFADAGYSYSDRRDLVSTSSNASSEHLPGAAPTRYHRDQFYKPAGNNVIHDDVRRSGSENMYHDRSRRSSTFWSYVLGAPATKHLDRQTHRSDYQDKKRDVAGGGFIYKLCVVVVVALMVMIAAGVGLGLGLGLSHDDGTYVSMCIYQAIIYAAGAVGTFLFTFF